MNAKDSANVASQVAGGWMPALREVVEYAGVPVNRVLVIMEVVSDDHGPINVAASWPSGQMVEASEMATQGAAILLGAAGEGRAV